MMCWGGGATVFELDGHCFVRAFHEESKGERGSVSMAGENGWLRPGTGSVGGSWGADAGSGAYLTSFIVICTPRVLCDFTR